MSQYFSFLICDHGDIVNLYYNGTPIGTITNGEFEIHQFDGPNGSKRSLMIEDLPQPCPFKTRDELVDRIYKHLHRMAISHREPQKK